MILRLLLLKRLSPFWYTVRLLHLFVIGLLIVGFIVWRTIGLHEAVRALPPPVSHASQHR